MLWVFKLIKASRYALPEWIYTHFYTVNSSLVVSSHIISYHWAHFRFEHHILRNCMMANQKRSHSAKPLNVRINRLWCQMCCRNRN